MNLTNPELIYVSLVLPSLFALTLIFEGLHKILRKESGWLSFIFGIVFLGIVLGSYFFVLR